MLTLIQKMPLVPKKTLTSVLKDEHNNPSLATINTLISRSLQYGDLIQLKRGVYIHKYIFEKFENSLGYLFFVANHLIAPSYISTQTALYYYGLLTDTISYTVTSISPGRTSSFRNKLGIFKYNSIKKSLFNHYTIKNIDGFQIYIATPYKAIFDFLYLRLSPKQLLDTKEVFKALNYYRINFKDLKKHQLNKLLKLIKNVQK